MHLCYVDDSGDARRGTTLSAILVEERHWTGLLDAWLEGRRQIHRTFGVPKTRELHANELLKGRGRYCETPELDSAFGTASRGAAARMMLAALAKFEHFTVVTVGSSAVSKATVYAQFIAWLEDWSEENETHLMVFYDGQQGLDSPGSDPSPERQKDLWETALRDATPYRRVHRDLDLHSRRIVEDVMMQDSRYSQLIQAVDLIAYGAYHKHLQEHREIWGDHNKHVPDAVRAYMKFASRWPSSSDFGLYWLG